MIVAAPFLIILLMAPFEAVHHKSAQKVGASSKKEISRQRAIEIARSHVKFKPKSIKAEKATENGRPVWRVTFRGEPVGKVNKIGEIMIISLHRFTGEIVSVAQS